MISGYLGLQEQFYAEEHSSHALWVFGSFLDAATGDRCRRFLSSYWEILGNSCNCKDTIPEAGIPGIAELCLEQGEMGHYVCWAFHIPETIPFPIVSDIPLAHCNTYRLETIHRGLRERGSGGWDYHFLTNMTQDIPWYTIDWYSNTHCSNML